MKRYNISGDCISDDKITIDVSNLFLFNDLKLLILIFNCIKFRI
jgi:hypothetical protein